MRLPALTTLLHDERLKSLPLHNRIPSTSSHTTITTDPTMLFVALALLINLFFVCIAISCMFWSFVVLLRFWCALLEVPLNAEVFMEIWPRVQGFGLAMYFLVLLETFLLWVSTVAYNSTLTVPDTNPCRSNRLREAASGRSVLCKRSMFYAFGIVSIETS